jgi:hypothetical protein
LASIGEPETWRTDPYGALDAFFGEHRRCRPGLFYHRSNARPT